MKFIDITVPLDSRLPTYPGNTPFTLEPIKRMATGGSSNVSALHLSAHAGTHVDAPFHVFEGGAASETLALELLCGRTRVLEITTRRTVTADDLSGFDLKEDLRVLLKTPNSRLWGSPVFHEDFVGLSESAARFLVDHGVKVVGVDYLSVEEFRKPGAPAHRTLLGQGVTVIEGLNLLDVAPGVYEMFCLPLRVVGSDGAPARVILRRT
jgi:arylformamidase